MEGVVGALASLIGYNPNNNYKDNASKTPDSWRILSDESSVCGIVLSLWDNISGPRIEQVWYHPNTDAAFLKRYYLESFDFVSHHIRNASFALNGEMIDGTSPDVRRQNIERFEFASF